MWFRLQRLLCFSPLQRAARGRIGGIITLLFVVALGVTRAPGQTSLYFDVASGNGLGTATAGSTTNWNSTVWNSASSGNGSRVGWTNGSLAQFNAGANAYTVDVQSAGTTFAGATVTTGNVTISSSGSGTLALSADAAFNVASGKTLTISTGFSGAFGLAVTNSGTLTLSGANTYTGQTQVQNGTLSISSLNDVSGGAASSSLGAPTTVANGTIALGSTTTTGTLKYTGAGETTDRVINLAGTTGGGTLDASGTGALVFSSDFTATGVGAKTLTLTGSSTALNTLSGVIGDSSGGATSLVKSGAGYWVLAGANTYTGTTTIGGTGALIVASNNALGAGGSTTVSSGATLGFSNVAYTTAEAVTATGAGVSGVGAITNTAGTSSFAGNVTLGGATTITANASTDLTLSGNVVLGTNVLTLGSAATGYTGNVTLSGNVSGTTGTPTATIMNVTAGTVTLSSNASSYAGNTVVGSGATLIVAAGNATATTGALGNIGVGNNATVVNSGGTLGFNGNINYAIAEQVTASGVGVGSLGAIQNLGGNNTFAGPITLGAATTISSVAGSDLNLTGGLTLGANAVTLGAGTNTGNILLSRISGSGSSTSTILNIVKGNVTVSNATSNYTGNTVVGTGAMLIVAAGSNNTTTAALGAIGVNNNATVVNSGGTLAFGNVSSNITYGIAEQVNATGTGVGGLGAIQNLAGTNSFAGPVILGGATSASAVTGTQLTLSGNVTLGANTFTVGNATNTGAMVLSGNVSGTGGLAVAGGTVTLSNATSTYSGGTTVNAGTLKISADGNLGAVSGGVTLGGGTLETTANFTLSSTRGITLSPSTSSNIVADTGTTLTYGGVISNAGNIGFGAATTGTGTITLTGTSNYTGTTGINYGTVGLSGASATLGSGLVTVANSAALSLTGGVALTNGALDLTGTGVGGTGALTSVSGTNTWTGNISLSGAATIGAQAGTLNLGTTRPLFSVSGNTQPTESGFITIGGQTLNFNGSGAIVVNERIQDNVNQTAGTFYTNPTTVAHSPQTTTDTGTGVFTPATPTAGDVTINMTGAGSVTFAANANSYTGTTTVQAGTLNLETKNNGTAPHDPGKDSFHAINGPLVIGTGSSSTTATVNLKVGGGANEVMGMGTTVELFKDGTLNINNNAQTIDALKFTGGTVNVGTGTLYLNNDVTVNASSGNLASITGTGALSLTLDQYLTVDTGVATRTFTVNHGLTNAVDLSVSAVVQKGNLVKAGTGTMVLSNNNDYTGYTSVTAGILNIQMGTDGSSRSGLGGGAGDSNDTQATFVNVNPFTFAATGTSGTLQLQNGITITNEKIYIAGNGFSSTDTAAQGVGPLGAINNLSGNNTLGTGVLGEGSLLKLSADSRINSSAGLLTIKTNIDSAATGNYTLTVGGAGNTTISGGILTGNATSATLVKDGSGTLILSGANSYHGKTDIQAGVVSVQNNSALGSTTTGSDGTFVASGAELQLSSAANGNLSIGGEALTINGAGVGGTKGALHNVAGTNTYGGVVTIGSASGGSAATIMADSGTALTLSGGTTSNNNYALTLLGAGNITVSGAMNNFSSTLIKGSSASDTGTFTFAGTSGTTTGSVGQVNLNYGKMTVGGGGGTTILTTKEFSSKGLLDGGSYTNTTLLIASGGTVHSVFSNGSLTHFNGVIDATSVGTFQMNSLAGTSSGLQFGTSFTSSGLTLEIGGATKGSTNVADFFTLKLSGVGITVGTIHITGDTILDFGGVAGTFLSSAQLVIDAGVNITVNNWISVSGLSASSTAWYATNTVNSSTLTGTDILGGFPLANITFTNYGGLTTTWVSTNHNGWFDHEIRPTPEPATYGAIFMAGSLGLLGWRRMRRKTAPLAA